MRILVPSFSLWIVSCLPAQQAEPSAAEPPFSLADVDALRWRPVGPANMGGRITDIEVPRADRATWYVATAGGGLWKTTNMGTTWTALFQHQPTSSIGDVATAPSDPEVVWVGTGEENARNSVSFGDGVYKSTDGGRTWRHMGLSETFQIGHIAIHPRDPDIVFVAALGRLWGPNLQRGVYRTRDGGKTWDKVLYLDERTGCIDVRIDPQRPRTVYACMYERMRDMFDSNDPAVRFGEKAGIFRSDDGGDTWKRLTRGLPTCKWGRSGLAIYEKRPSTIFAIIETERSGWQTGEKMTDPKAPKPRGTAYLGISGGEDSEAGVVLGPISAGGPAERAGLREGDVITRIGDKPLRKYSDLLAFLRASRAGEKVTVHVQRGDEELQVALTFGDRTRLGRGGGRRGGAAFLTRMLGVQTEDVEGGVKLTEVQEDRLAARAGFAKGDRIVEIEGKPAGNAESAMNALVETLRAGKPAKVVVLRAGQRKTLTVEPPSFLAGGRRGPARGPYAGRLGGQQPNVQDVQGDQGFQTGGIFRSDDRGETWRRINSLTDRPFYYSVLAVDPQDDRYLYSCGVPFYMSDDGGRNFRQVNRNIHVDFHAVWVDPHDGRHLVVGCDGGVQTTWDRCKTWEVLNDLPIGQFYHADVDLSRPYRIYGGLQDNGTWGGPSQTRFSDGITKEDWFQIYGGDGFTARVDPEDPRLVYATSQGGNIGLVDVSTGGRARVPKPGRDHRFNWDTPFFLSPHNPHVLYFAGNHAFRCDRGPRPATGMPSLVSRRLTEKPLGLTERGTATAMAESPREPGLLYVGTDDGALWRTKDGGRTWEELHERLGLPGPRYVSSIHPSRFATGRVYVTLDGHRSDDRDAYVFVSEDMGDSWRFLADDLPLEPVHVCREDPRNQNLLFVGTEFGCYVSLDRGVHWMPLGQDLPTVAVRDLAIHDRDSDLVAATHGRGLWILDIHALRQLDARIAARPAHLFTCQPAVQWRTKRRYRLGHKQWRAPNPPRGATIYARFATAPGSRPVVVVYDMEGKQVGTIRGNDRAGLQAFHWDARIAAAPPRGPATETRRRRAFGAAMRARPAPPGSYTVVLRVGEEEVARTGLVLLPDPIDTASPVSTGAGSSR